MRIDTGRCRSRIKNRKIHFCVNFSLGSSEPTGKIARFFCRFFSWVRHRKICRYYQQTQPFFMEYLSTNMLTFFRQKWYIHYGGIRGLRKLFRAFKSHAIASGRWRRKEVGSFLMGPINALSLRRSEISKK